MVRKLTSGFSLTANGLRDWLVQRFSAIILAIYFIALYLFFISHPDLDFSNLKLFFANPWMKIFTILALLSLLVHAWVGIWTVLTDYVKINSLRIAIQALVILGLLIFLIWGIEILWR